MNTLDAGFRLLPVVAELDLAAHGLLRFAQGDFMPLEAIERGVERAVREGGEAGYAHVYANNGSRRMCCYLDFAFGLDGNEPLAAILTDGSVLNGSKHIPAIAITYPTQFWQEQATVGLIELNLLRVWVAEAVGLPFLLEAREVGALGEEVGIRPLQILERLLQRVSWRIGQPCSFLAVAPLCEQLAQIEVVELLIALFVDSFLQRQRLIEHEPARASEAAHLPLLLAVWPEFKFEGLKSLHSSIPVVRQYIEQQQTPH